VEDPAEQPDGEAAADVSDVSARPGSSSQTEHDARVARLLEQYAAIPVGAPVRLAKRTSNLFRSRAATGVPGLDVTDFTNVLSVDPVARTADVEGMVTYERLVEATLAHGLMPMVVPQLRTITLGGAVSGLGIESSSFRNGLPHESVLELEVLTGDGRVVVARPDGPHADLFAGFPNSYGTLGYALRLKIELQPVKPYVRLRHVRHDDAEAFFAAMERTCADGAHDGEPVDFVDGTVFSGDEMYLTLGTFVDTAPYTSDYTGNAIYYRSLQQRSVDFLTVSDYLWRWDTDWFWCSRAFGVQKPAVRRMVPRKYLRSEVYWKIVAFERRHGVMARVDRWRGRPDREPVVQDIEVPVANAARFLDFFLREIPVEPIWVCPLRQRDPARQWSLYAFDPERLYVNFGFWSTVALGPGEHEGTYNRRIETAVDDLGGRKSLYSTSFYPRDEFWRLYNGPAYEVLKKEYDGTGRLLDLYAKCVQRR
jgi:FAD/FMN-containing dehydrogenase